MYAPTTILMVASDNETDSIARPIVKEESASFQKLGPGSLCSGEARIPRPVIVDLLLDRPSSGRATGGKWPEGHAIPGT
jgi:hypothetical protein